tara:strand:- start:170 stop:457 length:288 start_codon:yes stop_codon:yes gene_type:complete
MGSLILLIQEVVTQAIPLFTILLFLLREKNIALPPYSSAGFREWPSPQTIKNATSSVDGTAEQISKNEIWESSSLEEDQFLRAYVVCGRARGRSM